MKFNRIALHHFNKGAYKGRNVIERCFCRLKDFRCIASRYDKLARNFLAAVQRAAIVAYWIDRIWTLAQVGVVAKSPRKEIREDYQRPSALGHGVLASA